MKRILVTSTSAMLFSAALLTVPTTPVQAAAATDCLCRDDKGGFRTLTTRHHRWACDYRMGYLPTPAGEKSKDDTIERKRRPETQTCNLEEIVQWKVYHCVQSGCTYPWAASTRLPNRKLREITSMKGERRP